MGDPNKKALESVGGEAAKGALSDARRGAFSVRDANGNVVDVKNSNDLATARQLGYKGDVSFWHDGQRRTAAIEDLATVLTVDEMRDLDLALGDQAAEAIQGQMFETLKLREEEKGTGRRIRKSFEGSVFIGDDRTEFEKLEDKAGAEGQPVATIAGSGLGGIAALAGPGKFVKGAKGLAGLAASGARLTGEAAIMERGIANQHDRDMSTENILVDVAAGGTLGVLAKTGGKIIRKGAEKTAIGKLRKQKLLQADDVRADVKAAKRVTPAGVMKSKVKPDDIDAAVRTAEKAGKDVPKAQYVQQHSSRIPGLRKEVKAAAAEINQKVSKMSGMADDVRQGLKTAKVNATSNVNMGEAVMSMARQVRKVASTEANSGTAKKLGKLSQGLEKVSLDYAEGNISLADVQRKITEVGTEARRALRKSESATAGKAVDDVMAARHNADFFGEAAMQSKVAEQGIEAFEKASESMKRLIGSPTKVEKLLKGGDPAELMSAASRVKDVAEHLDDLNKAGVPGFTGDAYTAQKSFLDDLSATLQRAEGTLEAPGPMRLIRAVDDLHLEMMDVIAPSVAAPRSGFGAREAIFGSLGASVGGALGGGFGAGIGGALGVKFARGQLGGALSDTIATGMAKVDRGVANVSKAMGNDTARAAAYRVVGGTSHMFMSREEKMSEYEELLDGLQTATINPDFFVNDVAEALDVLEGSELVGAAAERLATATYYLANAMPKTQVPSATEVDGFMAKVDIVRNPHSALDHLAAGTFTASHRDALANVYPTIYGDMIASLMAEIDVEELSYKDQVALSTFVAMPLSATMQPEYIATFRNQGAQTQQQDQAINGARGNLVSQQLSTAEQTGTARIANK